MTAKARMASNPACNEKITNGGVETCSDRPLGCRGGSLCKGAGRKFRCQGSFKTVATTSTCPASESVPSHPKRQENKAGEEG